MNICCPFFVFVKSSCYNDSERNKKRLLLTLPDTDDVNGMTIFTVIPRKLRKIRKTFKKMIVRLHFHF